jgi:hypothetical protein
MSRLADTFRQALDAADARRVDLDEDDCELLDALREALDEQEDDGKGPDLRQVANTVTAVAEAFSAAAELFGGSPPRGGADGGKRRR